MNPTDKQTEFFLRREGDAWFERNRQVLQAKGSFFECDLITSELSPFRAQIDDILEIGCGDGHKAQVLSRFFDARAAGIDPSQKAVDHGRERLEAQGELKVKLQVGTADRLPWPDASFDLVYFGFCLYLVGRNELRAAIADATRVLRPGGFLVILDFDPAQPHRREYEHCPGLFSYKLDYAKLFTVGGEYHLFGKRSFSHSGHHFSSDPNERVAMSFLYRETDPYPLVSPTKVAP